MTLDRGRTVRFHRSLNAAPGAVKPEIEPPNCDKCRSLALARWLSDANASVPVCKDDDNTCSRAQFDRANNESFCVNKWGKEFENTRQKNVLPDQLDCTPFIDAGTRF